jgi:hypothetical protein
LLPTTDWKTIALRLRRSSRVRPARTPPLPNLVATALQHSLRVFPDKRNHPQRRYQQLPKCARKTCMLAAIAHAIRSKQPRLIGRRHPLDVRECSQACYRTWVLGATISLPRPRRLHPMDAGGSVPAASRKSLAEVTARSAGHSDADRRCGWAAAPVGSSLNTDQARVPRPRPERTPQNRVNSPYTTEIWRCRRWQFEHRGR